LDKRISALDPKVYKNEEKILEVENNMYSKMLALDDKYSSVNKNFEKMKRQIEETYNPFMELDNMKA
jgi:hypothetical protein